MSKKTTGTIKMGLYYMKNHNKYLIKNIPEIFGKLFNTTNKKYDICEQHKKNQKLKQFYCKNKNHKYMEVGCEICIDNHQCNDKQIEHIGILKQFYQKQFQIINRSIQNFEMKYKAEKVVEPFIQKVTEICKTKKQQIKLMRQHCRQLIVPILERMQGKWNNQELFLNECKIYLQDLFNAINKFKDVDLTVQRWFIQLSRAFSETFKIQNYKHLKLEEQIVKLNQEINLLTNKNNNLQKILQEGITKYEEIVQTNKALQQRIRSKESKKYEFTQLKISEIEYYKNQNYLLNEKLNSLQCQINTILEQNQRELTSLNQKIQAGYQYSKELLIQKQKRIKELQQELNFTNQIKKQQTQQFQSQLSNQIQIKQQNFKTPIINNKMAFKDDKSTKAYSQMQINQINTLIEQNKYSQLTMNQAYIKMLNEQSSQADQSLQNKISDQSQGQSKDQQ